MFLFLATRCLCGALAPFVSMAFVQTTSSHCIFAMCTYNINSLYYLSRSLCPHINSSLSHSRVKHQHDADVAGK